jgi:hypothetical protein
MTKSSLKLLVPATVKRTVTTPRRKRNAGQVLAGPVFGANIVIFEFYDDEKTADQG